MKKFIWILGIVITWELLLSPVSAICGYTTTAAYKISVTIPEHVMAPAVSQTSVTIGQAPVAMLASAAGTERIIEETTRDNQTVLLETFVVK